MQMDERIWGLLLDIQKKGRFVFYFVGGCVRDLCYGIHSRDIDIAFKGDVDELYELLKPHFEQSKIQKSNLSTLSLRGELFEFDFASPRKDDYPKQNGMPNIVEATVEEDLSRRDFTINTGYLEFSIESIGWIKGESVETKQIMSKIIHAHPMFETDIADKKLRILHPRSFDEDPSRLLRAVKYMVLLNLTLEKDSEIIFRKALNDRRIDQLDKARYLRIMWDYAHHDKSEKMMIGLEKHGLLLSKLSYLKLVKKVESLKFEWICEGLDKSLAVYVVLFYEYKNQMKTIGHSINIIVKETETILNEFKGILQNDFVKKKYQTYKILYNKKVESIACAILIGDASEWIGLYMTSLRHVKVHVTGGDLVRLGIGEGPQIGKLKEALLIYKLYENPTMDIDEEIKWIESAKNET